jgi:hypothetical protein
MDKDYLTFKPVSVSRPSSERHDYDVICDGAVVGQNIQARRTGVAAMDVVARLLLLPGPHADARLRATREAAMAAFAKSWRKS